MCVCVLFVFFLLQIRQTQTNQTKTMPSCLALTYQGQSADYSGTWSSLLLSPNNAFAYLTGASGLSVLDVATNPAAPARTGVYSLDDATHACVSPDSKYVYVVDDNARVFVTIDVGTNANLPLQVGSVPVGFYGPIAMSPAGGKYVYMGGSRRLSVVDVSDPTAPFIATTWNPELDTDPMEMLVVSPNGQFVYAAGHGTVAVINVLAEPPAPFLVGSVVDSHYLDGIIDLAMSPDGKTVYTLTNYPSYVCAVAVTVKRSPELAGALALDFSPEQLKLAVHSGDDGEEFVFVSNCDGHVSVVDFGTDQTHPTLVDAACDLDEWVTGMALSPDGTRLYFASKEGPIHMVGVETYAAPCTTTATPSTPSPSSSQSSSRATTLSITALSTAALSTTTLSTTALSTTAWAGGDLSAALAWSLGFVTVGIAAVIATFAVCFCCRRDGQRLQNGTNAVVGNTAQESGADAGSSGSPSSDSVPMAVPVSHDADTVLPVVVLVHKAGAPLEAQGL